MVCKLRIQPHLRKKIANEYEDFGGELSRRDIVTVVALSERAAFHSRP